MSTADNKWVLDGLIVAESDEAACGVVSTSGFICTLLPTHTGDHVAHVFDDDGSPYAVHESWPNTTESQPSLAAP